MKSVRENAMATGKDEMILYEASDGAVKLDVRLEGETVWLTQKQMAKLFETERSVVTKHLRNIFVTKELQEESNVQKMHILPTMGRLKNFTRVLKKRQRTCSISSSRTIPLWTATSV